MQEAHFIRHKRTGRISKQLHCVHRLVEQFGSTRRKRQLTAKENAVVRADAVGSPEALKDMLKTAADKAAESNMTKEEMIKQTQALRAILPHHPEATKPHDAYRSAFDSSRRMKAIATCRNCSRSTCLFYVVVMQICSS